MANEMKLSSDQPKTKIKDDKLGFAKPAEAIAKSIVAGKYPDGFVIGIEGEWGSGKTTFINFIRGHIKEKKSKFKVVEFKPWLHSSQENLIAAYFKLLSENETDIFGEDSSVTEDLVDIIETFSPAAELAANLASSGTLGGPLKAILQRCSKKLKKSEPPEPQTMEFRYQQIQEKLKKARKRFLVIIDDLDRLDETEVKTMLKLVKSVGKLPHVIYVLAYNRSYVEKATEYAMPNFLEKIVQLPISLPKPAQGKLLQMLDIELKGFLKNVDAEKDRWRRIVNNAIRPHMKKPRDVALLTNSVNFCFPAMKGVLDPADLFALECLRLFDENLWNWIRDNRDIIHGEGAYSFIASDKPQFKKILEDSLSVTIPKLSKNQKNTLSLLFPHLDDALDTDSYDGKEFFYKTRNRAGIAIPSCYNAYFSQYLEDTEISKADIDLFTESIKKRRKLRKTLRYWINRKDEQGLSKITEFLESVTYRFMDEQSPKPNQTLLLSLVDVFNGISSLNEPPAFFKSAPDDGLRYLFRELFRKMDKQENLAFLHHVCEQKKYIQVSIYLLHWIAHFAGIAYGNNNRGEKIDIIDETDWKSLTKIITPHLKDAFETGKVGDFSHVFPAAFLAAHIFGDAKAKELFKTAYSESDKYVIISVKQHLGNPVSEDGSSRYEFRKNTKPNLFDYDALAEKANEIDLEKQDEGTKEAITVFLRGVRGEIPESDF